jgi:glycosyltransferase involved in cell wall biosynthesis
VKPESNLRIAIASSGLGHIRRGVETWAEEIATAFYDRGLDVALFQGAGAADAPWKCVLPCLKRFDPKTQKLARVFRKLSGWRYGAGNAYDIEQTTFVMSLWPRVFRSYDILHVKEPWIALWMDRLHRAGLSRPRVILSHGTEEPWEFLRKYSNIQHMAPTYVEEYKPLSPPGQRNFVVPNFVDTRKFVPGDRAAARRLWKLEDGDYVALCVAAIRKFHKRIDYLLREFDLFRRRTPMSARLVVAGAHENETAELMEYGRQLLGDRVLFLENVPRSAMASLYHAADVFVLTSLHEMFGNVFLEAMATGLPVICNRTPVLDWVVGPAGLRPDLSRESALADALEIMADPQTRGRYAREARPYVERMFSREAVADQMIAMYREVLSA